MENLAEVEGMVTSSIACGPGAGGMMGVWRRRLKVRFAERNMAGMCGFVLHYELWVTFTRQMIEKYQAYISI